MAKTIETIAAKAFAMDEKTWARHANPWSVWTRNTVLPFLILAVWSRAWLGWFSLAPIIISILWMWLNPRVFPRPKCTDNWASKGVFGERIWLKRKETPFPDRHRVVPNILSGVAGSGLIFVIWGLVKFSVWPTLFGCALIYGGKLWFIDRMVWLYEDMKNTSQEYREWSYDQKE